MTRKLEINWVELDVAYQTRSWGVVETCFYLDLETGEVVMVTDEIARYLESPPDHELLDWMHEEIQKARRVEEGYGLNRSCQKH